MLLQGQMSILSLLWFIGLNLDTNILDKPYLWSNTISSSVISDDEMIDRHI